MEFKFVFNKLTAVAKEYGKDYGDDRMRGICQAFEGLNEAEINEVCREVVSTNKYLPLRDDFILVIQKLGLNKRRSEKVLTTCEWCNSTGQVDVYNIDTLGTSTCRCDCPAGANFSQSVPTFNNIHSKHKYKKLKYGQHPPERALPKPNVLGPGFRFNNPEWMDAAEKKKGR